MRITENTLNVLQNFQTINASIILKPGQKIKTMSVDKTILAEAVVEEDFTSEFGIYDLAQFINNLSILGKDSEIDMSDNVATIKNGGFQVDYRSCNTNLIASAEDKELPMDNILMEFDLDVDQFKTFLKLTAMNALKNIVMEVKDKKVYLSATDGSDTSNKIERELGDCDYPDVKVKFLSQHFKMISENYKVRVTPLFAQFSANEGKLVYYIVAQS